MAEKPLERKPVITRFKAIVHAVSKWLLTPVWLPKEIHKRLISRAIRSRFFLISAILTAAPVLFESIGFTGVAIRAVGHFDFSGGFVDSALWWGTVIFSWTSAALSWVLFILTMIFSKQDIANNKNAKSKSD